MPYANCTTRDCTSRSSSDAAMHAAVWAQDFAWIVSEYIGVKNSDDADARLFALARECIQKHHFAEARGIVVFLQNKLSGKAHCNDALAGIKMQLDALMQKSGNGGGSLTMAGIAEYLAAYADCSDIEGLLAARDRFGELLADEYLVILHRCVDELLEEIVTQPALREAHQRRLASNMACLDKMDPVAAARLAKLDLKAASRVMFRHEAKVFIRVQGIWRHHKPLRKEQETNEKALGECTNKAIVISCQGAVELFDILACFLNKSSSFNRQLCYLLVDFAEFAAIVTVMDFSGLLASDYVLKFIDSSRLEEGFVAVMRHQNCYFPERFFPVGAGDHMALNKRMEKVLAEIEKDILADLAEYAAPTGERYGDVFLATLPDKIARRTLRVLLPASRYTVFVRYAVRDMADALTALGCTCMVLMEGEQENAGMRADIFVEHIREFKPDLVISMNHNRGERIPENLPWINWVQDELDATFGAQRARSSGKHDFWGYVHPHWREKLRRCGYPEERFFHFPLGTNTSRFQPCVKGGSGFSRSSEISYVANCSSTAQEEFDNFQASISAEYRGLFERVFCQAASAFEQNTPLWDGEDYVRLIQGIAEQYGQRFPVEQAAKIADRFWHLIGGRFYRQEPLVWLSEAGYDLALYGHGWEKHPLLAKHARGYATHGEALSRIYSTSAINLSIHETGNYTARIFDGFASGGFFLFRYHPADFREGGLQDFLNPATDVIYFSDRENLLEKIDFYLNNREAREQFSASVRNKILSRYDYKVIMGNVLDFMQQQYGKQSG